MLHRGENADLRLVRRVDTLCLSRRARSEARKASGRCRTLTHSGNSLVINAAYTDHDGMYAGHVEPDRYARAAAQRAGEVMAADATLHTTKPNVLIVDDDATLRRMVSMVLEDASWESLQAKDGLEALATMRSSPSRLVVLLDWKMPEISGEELLEVVLATPELATRHAYALITANAAIITPHLADLLSQLEAPTIAKPFSIDELLCAVELQARRIAEIEVAD